MTPQEKAREIVQSYSDFLDNLEINAEETPETFLAGSIAQALRDVRREALEEAAKICDEDNKDELKWFAKYTEQGNDKLARESLLSAAFAKNTAIAIRSLLNNDRDGREGEE